MSEKHDLTAENGRPPSNSAVDLNECSGMNAKLPSATVEELEPLELEFIAGGSSKDDPTSKDDDDGGFIGLGGSFGGGGAGGSW